MVVLIVAIYRHTHHFYFSEVGHELFDLACKSLGSTKGEATAFYTYYRQRLAITNIRGVAKTILQRIPFCTGLHFPITPHHFNTVHIDVRALLIASSLTERRVGQTQAEQVEQ